MADTWGNRLTRVLEPNRCSDSTHLWLFALNLSCVFNICTWQIGFIRNTRILGSESGFISESRPWAFVFEVDGDLFCEVVSDTRVDNTVGSVKKCYEVSLRTGLSTSC